MFAVFATGGKQYRATVGEVVRVEHLDGMVGETVTLDQVLMIGGAEEVKIGHPKVEGANLTCEIVGQGRHRKIIVFKHKRRKGHRKTQGHRQYFTALRIKEINA
ncbi:MAG: 50S ribosomal protein L21 [Pseudomonadota bacterium]